MSVAIAEEMPRRAEDTIQESSLATGIVGEFSPLDEFHVSFAVQTTPLAVFPPEWVVQGSIRCIGSDSLPISIFNLGPQHRTQTVRIEGEPDAYSGTMELTLMEGKAPSFTVKYALKQASRTPMIKKGTYVFYWSV